MRRRAAVNADAAIAVSSASTTDISTPQFLFEHPHLPLPLNKLILIFELHTPPCNNAHSHKDCHSPNCPHVTLTKGVFAKRATPTAALGRDPNDIQRTTDGYTGLRNLGATCYLNTLFQSLIMNTHFSAAFPLYTSSAAASTLSTATTSARVSPLPVHPADKIDLAVNDILQLFAMMKFGGRRYISPFAVVKALDIESHIQQDVHEFNALILSMFESAFNASDQRQALTNKHGAPLKLGQLLAHLFKGEKRDVRQCCVCQRETFTSSDFYDLQLALTGLHENTVNAALQQYTHTELLCHGNQVTCANCGCKQDMTRSEQIHRLPPYLTLHLQRFCYDINSNSKKKVHDAIFVPDTLAMDKYVAQQCIDKEVQRRQTESERIIKSPTPHNQTSITRTSLSPLPLPIRSSTPTSFAPTNSTSSLLITSPTHEPPNNNSQLESSSSSPHLLRPIAAQPQPNIPLLISSLSPIKSSHSPISAIADSIALEPAVVTVEVAKTEDDKMDDIHHPSVVNGSAYHDNRLMTSNGITLTSMSSFQLPNSGTELSTFLQALHSPTPLPLPPSSPLREVGVLPSDRSPAADTDTDMTRDSDDDASVEVMNAIQPHSPIVTIEITDDSTDNSDALKKPESNGAGPRMCQRCNALLPSKSRSAQKFCSVKCKDSARPKQSSKQKSVKGQTSARGKATAESSSIVDPSANTPCEVCANGKRVGESICSNSTCPINSDSHEVRRSARKATLSPALAPQIQSTMDSFVTSPLATKATGKRRASSAGRSILTSLPAVSSETSPTVDVAASAVFAYDLTAVLMHKGTSANSGHYIAFIRDERGVWWKFDDENVTPVGAHWYEVAVDKPANTSAKKTSRPRKKSKGDESDEYEPPKDSDSGDDESAAPDDDSVQLIDDGESSTSKIRSKRRRGRKPLTLSSKKKQKTSTNAIASTADAAKDDGASSDVLVTSSASSFVQRFGSGGTSKEAYMLIYAARNRNERLQQWPSSNALWNAAEHLKLYVSNQQKALEDAKSVYAEHKVRLDAIAAKRRKAATALMNDLQTLDPLSEKTSDDDIKLCRFVPYQWLHNLLNGVNEREKKAPGRKRKDAESDASTSKDDVQMTSADDASPEVNLVDEESKAEVIDLREPMDPKQNGINLTGSDDENDETSMASDNAASGNGAADGTSGSPDDPVVVDAVRADMSEESIRAGFARALEQLVPHKLSVTLEQLHCPHKRIDPRHSKKLKRVTIDAWSRIVDLYLEARDTAPAPVTDPLMSSSLPLEDETVLREGVTVDHLCQDCAREAFILSAKRSQQVKHQAALVEKIVKAINEEKEEDKAKEQIVLEYDENNPPVANRTPARERDSDRFLLSRDWFNRFKSKTLSQRKNIDKDKTRTYTQQLDLAKRQSLAQQAETNDVNGALVCRHGKRATKAPVVYITRKNWIELIKLLEHGKHTLFNESTPLCSQCEEEETAQLTSFNSVKDERDAVGRWSADSRGFPDAKKPPHSDKKGVLWYIVTAEFRERVHQYTQGQSGLIKPVFDVQTLLCPHDMFKYSPYPYTSDETDHMGGTAIGHLVLVNKTDFEHLKKFGFIDANSKFDGAIAVSALNHPVDSLAVDLHSWEYLELSSTPPVCVECVLERRRIEESAAFEDGTITAILKNAEDTTATTQRRRAVRSSRHRTAVIRGIHSAMTIETLKMKIFEHFGIEPVHQKLTYKTNTLELADMSIAQYSVPNRAEITVEPVDNDDGASWNFDGASHRNKKETGFSGTTFYSVQTLPPIANGHDHAANGNGIIHIDPKNDDTTMTADEHDGDYDVEDVRPRVAVAGSPVYEGYC